MTRHTPLLSGLGAYLLWGLFPLYFVGLSAAGPLEILAHRIVWTLAFCALALTLTRSWASYRRVWSDRRQALLMVAAGLTITTNWGTYVLGVLLGRTLEASLGYFINPLAVVALGVLVFQERLRPLQVVAVGFGGLSVLVMALGYGQVPWIALVLAASFGSYSLLKKLTGISVAPVAGLAAETSVTAPLALGYLGVLSWLGHSTFGFSGHGLLLAISGVVTALPLLLFAVAAKGLPMITLGTIQYVGPLTQFVIGWLVLGEPMPASRWLGFAAVWVAVALFVFDAVRASWIPRGSRIRRCG
ncbi:EamA family transporter RarD [Tessaracoccus sp. OH4464_COT-324]|uniref:EamA family transporter RarD n=1 Tax=Tessaracoccus sp. OH4464_COT-324 TaxID=2491059 RepID=UPI000F634BD0|nr:EamA family transporter RarD [Tessaracoccus sp. OH4464_COT-324]RRD47724.1 EamA family transporter RarD [Tessaracoccus sp. OH4464_COT-324]